MTDTAVDIPIVKEDEKGVEIQIESAKPAKQDTKIVTVDEGIDSLKEQAEKARRESSERLAAADRKIAEAYRVASEAQRETATVKLDQVGTIIDNLTKDKEAARRDYRVAMEAGDFDKAADAQDRIATAAARIVKAEEGKLELADAVKNPPRPPAQSAADPVEAVARSMASQRSANWVRNHPEMVVNGEISALALAGHNLATHNGHAPDTDGYFNFIEQFVMNSGRQQAEPRQERRDETQGRNMNASVSAPVGRETTQTPGAQRPNSIRLEPHEVQTAIDTFSPLYPNESRDQILKRYAMNKAALMDEGKIGRRA